MVCCYVRLTFDQWSYYPHGCARENIARSAVRPIHVVTQVPHTSRGCSWRGFHGGSNDRKGGNDSAGGSNEELHGESSGIA